MDQLKEFSNQFYPYMTKAFERSKINFESLKGSYLISLRPCFGSTNSGILVKVLKIDSDSMGKFLVVKHPEAKETKKIYENDDLYGQWFLGFAVISEKDFKYLDSWPPYVDQVAWEVKNLGAKISDIPTYRLSR